MAPDNLQQAWRAHASQTLVTVDADLLLKEVQRSQQTFRAMIFFRDFREVGVALVLLPYWFYAGITQSLPWLEKSSAWTKADQAGMKAWLAQYCEWLQTSKNGKEEAIAKNNHGTWYDVRSLSSKELENFIDDLSRLRQGNVSTPTN